MATFFENLRSSGFPPTRGDIQKARRTKKVAHGSMDTSNGQQDNQSGYLSDKDYIVQNTFRMDRDGTNYGVGRDGKTYSYTVAFNNKVSEPKLLSAEEQRNAISKMTNGSIQVNPDVTNQESLTDIFRSVNRMYDKGGKLIPEKAIISDMFPGSYVFLGAPAGSTFHTGAEDPDEIKINGLGFPEFRRNDEEESNTKGWWTDRKNKALGEGVITHELSHSTQNAMGGILSRWLEKKEEEAKANENKYPADKLFVRELSRLYGKNYELGEEDTVGYKILQDAYDKYNRWNNEIGNSDKGYGGLRIITNAAKNLGFDSVEDAADSISGYAGKRFKDPLRTGDKEYKHEYVKEPEVFAEAYTDVLLNDEEAAPFSKEIIRLYKEYADDLSDKTGWRKSDPFKDFKEMFKILPNYNSNNAINRTNPFIQNYRNAPWKYKK